MLRLLIALGLILTLSACGESRLNPLNWFGGEREQRITVTEEEERTTDPRPLVSEIIGLTAEPTTSGLIVRATGRTPTQGYFAAELLDAGREGSTLILEFRAEPPLGGAPEGTPQSREIVAAVDLGPSDLQGLTTITVIGQTNRRSVSRR